MSFMYIYSDDEMLLPMKMLCGSSVCRLDYLTDAHEETNISFEIAFSDFCVLKALREV